MALLDFILDRTGAIGARIRGYRLESQRDSLIMRRPRSPVHTTITTADGKKLAFDAATDIGHSFPSKVTSYPVEDRSTVSDHVVNENPRFTVSGVFSDATLNIPFIPNHYKQSEVYRMLLKMRDDRKVVSLLTPIDTYSELIVTNVSLPKSTGRGGALFVDLEFEKIRRVSAELTTVFVGSTATNNNGDSNKTQTGTTATNNAKEKDAGNKPAQVRTSVLKTTLTATAASSVEATARNVGSQIYGK